MDHPALWAIFMAHWSPNLENLLWRCRESHVLVLTRAPSAAGEKQLCRDILSVPNYNSWLFLQNLSILTTIFLSPFYSYPSHQDLTVFCGLFIILLLALAKLVFLHVFVGDPSELVGNRSSSSCITGQSFLGTFWEWLASLGLLYLLSQLLRLWPLDPLLPSSFTFIIDS